MSCSIILFFFFFKQKTAYEMRISDWSQTCALPICIGIDDIVVVEGEQEGMAVLVLVAVLLVHLVVGAPHALVTDDALALFDGFGGEHAVAVDGRQAAGDLLFWHCLVPDDSRKCGLMAHPARPTRPAAPARPRTDRATPRAT